MKCLALVLLFFSFLRGYTQDEIPVVGEEQTLEEHADWIEETFQKLDQLKQHPLDLNQISEDELRIFPFITALQIDYFMQYIKLLGPLVEILELQAIPQWDVETIKKILPFVVVKKPGTRWDYLKKDMQKNNQMILYRTNFNDILNFHKSKYSSTALIRYRFSSNTVQAGLQIEKDKGEKWWNEKKGLPFMSGYISVKPGGFIKEMMLGDYQIGMGQGLVLGMGRGVIKSTASMQIKRQTPSVMPFRSTDENKFMRGFALVMGKKIFQGVVFASENRIDGNIIHDTIHNRDYITSLQSSGLHVTDAELEDWDAVKVDSYGMIFKAKIPGGEISLNHVNHHFEKQIWKQGLPYNLYSMEGSYFKNTSMAFGKTMYNTHFFGEFAIGQKYRKAFLLGALVAIHRNVDYSILIRNYDVGYHSYLSKSMSESSEPSNERGIYNGISLKIHPGWILEAYADWYSFPWLKYRLDRPSNGKDHVIQLTWKPDKKTIFTVRYKDETKYINADRQEPLHGIGPIQKTSIRSQMEHHPSLNWKWRARLEYVKVNQEWNEYETGMLFFADLFWTKMHFSINGRLMYCNTDGFNSRIYAYENDVLYYGHISSFQGNQIRTYLNVELQILKNVQFYTKISRGLIRSEVVIKL